jgi:hypothetical protein
VHPGFSSYGIQRLFGVALALAAVVAYKVYSSVHHYFEPAKSVQAQVVDSRANRGYFIVFDITDEGQKSFMVSRDDFYSLKKGQTGLLTYKSNRCLKFDIRKGSIPDAP